MCGIVGYIGKRDAYPVLIKGLRRLGYRGYDSAGVALIDKKRRLNVYKTKGKVSDLKAFVSQKDVSGTIGIVRTRWATHGEPYSANAHPHISSSEHLALIHNGIIENYATLKEKLQKKGFIFKSSTDTDVLVQLIEYLRISNHLDLLTVVQLALHEVIGAYAIAVVNKNNPDEIVAARKSSLPIVGIGNDECFLASDATPVVEYINKVVYLQDGEIALIRRNKELGVVYSDNVLQNPEMKHGPIALIDIEMPVIVGATHNAIYEKITSNIQEIEARKGKVTEGDTIINKPADDCIELPETLECMEPLISTILLQLPIYHVAVFKGEKCRSTTKSDKVGDCGVRMKNSLDCFPKQSRDLQKTIKRPLTNSKEVFWGDTNKYMY